MLIALFFLDKPCLGERNPADRPIQSPWLAPLAIPQTSELEDQRLVDLNRGAIAPVAGYNNRQLDGPGAFQLRNQAYVHLIDAVALS